MKRASSGRRNRAGAENGGDVVRDPVVLRDGVAQVLASIAGPLHQTEIQKRMPLQVSLWEVLQSLHQAEELFCLASIGAWNLTQEGQSHASALPPLPPPSPAKRTAAKRTAAKKDSSSGPTSRTSSQEDSSSPPPPVPEDDATLHLRERIILALREGGGPVPGFEAQKIVREAGLEIDYERLMAIAERGLELIRYPFGQGRWLGLMAWGEEGYARAAEPQWKVVHAQLSQVARGERKNPFNVLALQAIQALARQKEDAWAAGAAEGLLNMQKVSA